MQGTILPLVSAPMARRRLHVPHLSGGVPFNCLPLPGRRQPNLCRDDDAQTERSRRGSEPGAVQQSRPGLRIEYPQQDDDGRTGPSADRSPNPHDRIPRQSAQVPAGFIQKPAVTWRVRHPHLHLRRRRRRRRRRRGKRVPRLPQLVPQSPVPVPLRNGHSGPRIIHL